MTAPKRRWWPELDGWAQVVEMLPVQDHPQPLGKRVAQHRFDLSHEGRVDPAILHPILPGHRHPDVIEVAATRRGARSGRTRSPPGRGYGVSHFT